MKHFKPKDLTVSMRRLRSLKKQSMTESLQKEEIIQNIISKERIPLLHYHLPLAGIKFSTNHLYTGIHWGKRKYLKDQILQAVALFCRPRRSLQEEPLEISYRFFFETRALDTLNTVGMAKCIEDSLHTLGVLIDDSPRYVRRSVIESIPLKSKNKIKNDFVEIEIIHIT